MKSSIDERLERLRARHTQAVMLGLPEAQPRDTQTIRPANRVLDKLLAGEAEEREIRDERRARARAAEGRRLIRWHQYYVTTECKLPPGCDCPLCRPQEWAGVNLTQPPNYYGKARRHRGQR